MKLRNLNEIQSERWNYILNKVSSVMKLYNFNEIKPSYLQNRRVLESSLTKKFTTVGYRKRGRDMSIHLEGEESYSLRPEGTVNVISEYLKQENLEENDIIRWWYSGNMFRREHGIIQEINFLGSELYGDDSVVSELTIIELALKVLDRMGIKNIWVEIDSFGCKECQQKITDGELESIEFCDKCSEHLRMVRRFMNNLMIKYVQSDNLEKKFKYYNGLVFNIYTEIDGKKSRLGGGGRYDNLTEYITGRYISSVGFEINLDKIYWLLEKNSLFPDNAYEFCVYICSANESLRLNELLILQDMRKKELCIKQGRVKENRDSAIKSADKNKASVLIYLTDESMLEGKVEFYNIAKNKRYLVSLDGVVKELEIIKSGLRHLVG